MMKQFTLSLAASCLVLTGWTQVCNPVQYAGDSLKGFNADSVQAAIPSQADAFEARNMMHLAMRDFIDKKYNLGFYDQTKYPTNLRQNNPVNVQASCSNVDFEAGDFSGWSGYIGDNNSSSFGPLNNITPGIFSVGNDAPVTNAAARHTIMTTASGNDIYGNFPCVPAGFGNFTARMGNAVQPGNYRGEILEQTFTVSAASTSFAYQYAVVLNDPGSTHAPNQKPYFKIEVLDQNGNPISPCTQYFVTAGNNPGFILSPVAATDGTQVYYKPWSTVNFDLSAYLTQNVTVRFTVAGCTLSGHWGYAYINCACSRLAATANFCPGNPVVLLNAPAGYGSYQWLDPSHNYISGATYDTLTITNPVIGDTFFVYLTSSVDTSCHNILPVVLEYTVIYPNATSTNESCYGYTDAVLTANGSAGIPPYSYSWNTSPPQSTQTATNITPGTYMVTMTDSLGCLDVDTVVVTQPPRIDTSDIVYTFCPGDPTITLAAPFGYSNYVWIGPNGDTLSNGSPPNFVIISGPQQNQLYTCIEYPAVGCPIYDSIILNLNPPINLFTPDKKVNIFTPNGDGVNDYFYPYFDSTYVFQQAAAGGGQPAFDFTWLYINTFEIWIYNRWGQQVFYSNDYNFGWDGKYSGKNVPEGVYYYVTKMTSRCKPDMEPIIDKGFVHVKR